ncbi:polyprenyl diphosphate synthase [Pelagibacteraceae bacterium]|nr:polyprenyl diphosphate synthase [Pelagibacteraceae bacterium]
MNKLNHVAFIMDGNGRWGIKKKKNRNFGHLQGVKTVQKVVEYSMKLKIPIVTFYVFSTENWKRPKKEIKFLFSLINSYFKKEIKNVINNGIRINILGKIEQLPENLKKNLKKTLKRTKFNKKLIVNLALNYGSKKEIVDTIIKLRKKKTNITEHSISKNLYTKNLANPDILIRTGGQKRLSNFMLWQLAYAEFYFLEKLWPDFNESDLKKIIRDYSSITRNFGTVND